MTGKLALPLTPSEFFVRKAACSVRGLFAAGAAFRSAPSYKEEPVGDIPAMEPAGVLDQRATRRDGLE
jgi:hypothetical protein